jgi:hypothetical protein
MVPGIVLVNFTWHDFVLELAWPGLFSNAAIWVDVGAPGGLLQVYQTQQQIERLERRHAEHEAANGSGSADEAEPDGQAGSISSHDAAESHGFRQHPAPPEVWRAGQARPTASSFTAE